MLTFSFIKHRLFCISLLVFIALFYSCTQPLYSREFAAGTFGAHDSVIINPSGSRFAPLRANYDEARLGVLYFPENGNLKVDIGTVMDIVSIPVSGATISLAVEFMAYAYATNYKEYRLQIDVIDGFFGGNLVYSTPSLPQSLFRFRFIHNSAHLVDGRFDNTSGLWRNGEIPKPYTRDFAEIVYEHKQFFSEITLRSYAGVSYGVHIRPEEIDRPAFITGAECYFTKLSNTFFNTTLLPYFALQYGLTPAPKLRGGFHVLGGVKAGQVNGKGLGLYISYYTGPSYFHEWYNEAIHRFGIGFSVDFE